MNFYKIYFSAGNSDDNWMTVQALNPVHAANRSNRILSENYKNFKILRCVQTDGNSVESGGSFLFMNEAYTWSRDLGRNVWLCENTRTHEDAYFQLDDENEIVEGPMTIEEAAALGIFEDMEGEPEPIPEGPAYGMASVLNSLIVDEYEAIEGYNAAIATAQAEGFDDIVKILTDIQAEEQIHVGQLQKAMEKFDPNAIMVQDGIEEATKELEEDDITDSDAQGLLAAYDTVQQKGNTYNE